MGDISEGIIDQAFDNECEYCGELLAVCRCQRDEEPVIEACDGSAVTQGQWCPDCDMRTKHVCISDWASECCECGAISERTTQ